MNLRVLFITLLMKFDSLKYKQHNDVLLTIIYFANVILFFVLQS